MTPDLTIRPCRHLWRFLGLRDGGSVDYCVYCGMTLLTAWGVTRVWR